MRPLELGDYASVFLPVLQLFSLDPGSSQGVCWTSGHCAHFAVAPAVRRAEWASKAWDLESVCLVPIRTYYLLTMCFLNFLCFIFLIWKVEIVIPIIWNLLRVKWIYILIYIHLLQCLGHIKDTANVIIAIAVLDTVSLSGSSSRTVLGL